MWRSPFRASSPTARTEEDREEHRIKKERLEEIKLYWVEWMEPAFWKSVERRDKARKAKRDWNWRYFEMDWLETDNEEECSRRMERRSKARRKAAGWQDIKRRHMEKKTLVEEMEGLETDSKFRRIVSNRIGMGKRERGEIGTWRLEGRNKKKINIPAGWKRKELEGRRRARAGRRAGQGTSTSTPMDHCDIDSSLVEQEMEISIRVEGIKPESDDENVELEEQQSSLKEKQILKSSLEEHYDPDVDMTEDVCSSSSSNTHTANICSCPGGWKTSSCEEGDFPVNRCY